MYIKYSFFIVVLGNLSIITASELPIKKNPICYVDLFDLNHFIVHAQRTRHVYSDSHKFTLDNDCVVEHMDFLNDRADQFVDSYTLLVRYNNKQYGVVASTKVLHLSAEQLKRLRSSYSQLYPVE